MPSQASKTYEVAFEVQAPAALFARPDTGSTPISYPVPTVSALTAMFESVARLRSAKVRPTKVEVCKPVRYERYVTNYGGPLRKTTQIRGGNNYQLSATILVDVHYRVHGVVQEVGTARNGTNHLHALQEIFLRRLEKGQFFHTPYLGWKEFVPRYFGPPRSGTKPDDSVSMVLPSLLHKVFDRPNDPRVAPHFLRNVEVRGGVLLFQAEGADAG